MIIRLAIYAFTILCFTAVYNAWAPAGRDVAFYVGYYGVRFVVWAAIFEVVYRIFRPRKKA